MTKPTTTALGCFLSSALFGFLAMWLSFAVIYGLLDAYEDGQSFGFQNTIIDPLYFSGTTCATIGYGDITPKTRLARCIVMVNFLCTAGLIGFILCAVRPT